MQQISSSGGGIVLMRKLSDEFSVGLKEAFGVPRFQIKVRISL